MAAVTSSDYDAAVKRAREELRVILADVIVNKLGHKHTHHSEELAAPAPIEEDVFVCILTSDNIAPVEAGEARDKWNAKMETLRSDITEGMANDAGTKHGHVHTSITATPWGERMSDDTGCEFKLVFTSSVPEDCAVARVRRIIFTSIEQSMASDGLKCTLRLGRALDASDALRMGVSTELAGDVEVCVKKIMDSSSPKIAERLREMGAAHPNVYVDIQRHCIKGDGEVDHTMFIWMFTV